MATACEPELLGVHGSGAGGAALAQGGNREQARVDGEDQGVGERRVEGASGG